MILRLPSRLQAKIVVAETGCWLWTGAASGGSATAGRYGHAWDSAARKVRRAHILVYELLVGPVPSGLELDHSCRTRLCVNPDHLEPTTHAENVRRGRAGLDNNASSRKSQ